MRRLRPSWPLIVFLLAFARALGGGWALLNDPDTYLHIAAGRWMIAHRALPLHDPFSSSLAGAPWIAHEWLAEVILARLYDLTGWGGLMVATALCFALTLALLTRRLLAQAEPFTVLILAGASAALIQPHLLARPHALALPLLAAWSGSLFAARDAGRAPPWSLLPVMLVWANLHGSFMAGLALVVVLGAEAVVLREEAAWRRWGLFLLAAIAAALITPNGLAGFLEPFRLSAMPVLGASFVEWRATDFSAFQPLEIWLLGAVLLGFASGLRLAWPRLLLVLVFFHLALGHVRHGDLLAIMGPLAVAASLGPPLAQRIRGDRPSALGRRIALLAVPAGWPATALMLGLTAVLALPTIRFGDRPLDAITPASALEAAERLDLTGPVLNSEPFGGYLVFRGLKPFIDGRMELYGDAFLEADLAAEAGREPALDQVLDHYGIAWTLLAPQSQAVVVLDHLPGWQRVYEDGTAVIHRRRTRGDSPSPPARAGGGEN